MFRIFSCQFDCTDILDKEIGSSLLMLILLKSYYYIFHSACMLGSNKIQLTILWMLMLFSILQVPRNYNCVLFFCAWKDSEPHNKIFKGKKSISDCFTIFSIPKILRCFRDAKEETVPSPHVPCTQHPIIFFRLF